MSWPVLARLLLVPAAALVICVGFGADSAQAKWGPTGGCGIANGEHCYAISEWSPSILGSVAADDNETAIVYDWEKGGFYSQEHWVAWPFALYPQNVGWVEAGIIEGYKKNCCLAYPFSATWTQSNLFHIDIAPGPVESGSGRYNFTMISDAELNGVYHVYWSSATNTANWFQADQYGGGRPVLIQRNKAGLEVATEVNPYHAGRDQVAGFNLIEFLPWVGAKTKHDKGICVAANRESGAAGNLEWTPGHNEC